MLVNPVGHSAATTRSDHETRNIGTGSGACPHRRLCIRAIQRRLGGRRFVNGRCGSQRHDIRIYRDRHDVGQRNGYQPRHHRHVQQRRQRCGRRKQRTKPVGEYADQPLAQRFNSDACTWRPITSGRQQKAPLWRGFFYSLPRWLLLLLFQQFFVFRDVARHQLPKHFGRELACVGRNG